MTKIEIVERLTELLEPVAAERGLELVAIEFAGGRGTPILRIMLDAEGGITLDAVAEAARWISETLDEQDPVAGAYTLEVSSPGIDRPLVKRADFERFAGSDVHIKTATGDKRKSWHGVLVGMHDDDVLIDVDGERVNIPYETVQKARLKGVVDFGKERGAV